VRILWQMWASNRGKATCPKMSVERLEAGLRSVGIVGTAVRAFGPVQYHILPCLLFAFRGDECMQNAHSGQYRSVSPPLWLMLLAFPLLALLSILGYDYWLTPKKPGLNVPLGRSLQAQEPNQRIKAPELEGGVAWINSAGPIQIHRDLKGKIVVLDFWTFCCINCIHTLPDLARLEKKYEKEVVVIGVHAAKFDNEKNTEAIRKAVLRYQIKHPVVNDAGMKIWDNYGCSSWPTLAVVDPEGNFVGVTSGGGQYELLDKVIQKLIEEHTKKK